MARVYSTKSGDRWDSISKNMYGAEKFAYLIMQANPAKIDILQFDSGVNLTIPDLPAELEENSDLPSWRQE